MSIIYEDSQQITLCNPDMTTVTNRIIEFLKAVESVNDTNVRLFIIKSMFEEILEKEGVKLNQLLSVYVVSDLNKCN
jgi:hypothetical protein